MHRDYWVLTKEERAKGFVRPVRRSYVHVGPPGPRYPLQDLTAAQRETFDDYYAKFEPYPEGESSKTGRYWTQAQLDAVGKGCGTVTTMGDALAETYARQPNFYGATFCCACREHYPVAEFHWLDTDEEVGS